MPEGYTPTAVRNAPVAKIQTLPEQPRQPLTWGRGPAERMTQLLNTTHHQQR